MMQIGEAGITDYNGIKVVDLYGSWEQMGCQYGSLAGELYAVNAINAKGLMVELNNGMPSAGQDILFERFAGTTELLKMMFEADTIDYIDAFFQTEKSFAAFIIGVADKDESRAYEWCIDGCHRAENVTPDGLMAFTNHYLSPEWQYAQPADDSSWNSLTRRKNLLAMASEHKGRIDAAAMCRIMETPIGQGGPLHEHTRYQMVFEPAAMKLMVRIIGEFAQTAGAGRQYPEERPSWTSIDLTKHFSIH